MSNQVNCSARTIVDNSLLSFLLSLIVFGEQLEEQ